MVFSEAGLLHSEAVLAGLPETSLERRTTLERKGAEIMEAIKVALEVYGLGFVISMVVALLINVTHKVIDASIKS